MNKWCLNTWGLLSSAVGVLSCVQPIVAQVVPDNTLPVGERSQVTGDPNVQIDGGAVRGSNLFHSFSQFSIPTGGSAYFNNTADVQNIFSRITGGAVSNIDGTIRANGTANLFLLNPHGILFGPNASLNIGGSFIVTTANSINFADGFQYSATNLQTAPLLTVSVPVGLQVGANPGRIGVQGNGYDLSVAAPIFFPLVKGSSGAGLRVPVGQTIALVGGDIDMNGGTLSAEQGRIELVSVLNGQVSLGNGFTLSYPGVQTFGNIHLSQQALADASGGGLIQVQGNDVSLTDGSLLLIQNTTQQGGSIRVSASSSLDLSGISQDVQVKSGMQSETIGSGEGASITVITQQLGAQDGAGISAFSFSSGKTGNITISAPDSVQMTGASPNNFLIPSSISTAAFNAGDIGNISISTGQLILFNGGSIASTNFGTGRGGDLTINATQSVEVIGQTSLFLPSNVSASTYNSGGAGVVTINTSKVLVRDGGVVATSTLAIGDAGSLTINARESVELSGAVPGSVNPSFLGSSATFLNESLQRLFNLSPVLSGNSGDVIINTGRLSVQDIARVDVSNLGIGNAGNLTVNANSISLDRGGSITAATVSGEGGNLDLNVRDLLLLRNNSLITASAGGNGNGGNIRINTASIVAVPIENSDIRANSVNARGGNITINTSGIFGIQFRPQDTPLSDITATGATSAQQGTVQLNIEQFDPTSGLVQLPTTVVDSRPITQGCPANEGNAFIITGRGGLPPTPEQQLDDDAKWQDRRRLTAIKQTTHSTPYALYPSSIIEATGWIITPTKEISLVANTSNSMGQNSSNRSITCHRPQ
jgi:filamentous hemagglutinin family protein